MALEIEQSIALKVFFISLEALLKCVLGQPTTSLALCQQTAETPIFTQFTISTRPSSNVYAKKKLNTIPQAGGSKVF